MASINDYVAVIYNNSLNSFSPDRIPLKVPMQCLIQIQFISSVLLQKLQMVKLT